MKVAMLLLAAGRGSRMGGEVPKAYLPLAGVPILLRSAQRLAQVADPRRDGQLIVVRHPDDQPLLQPLLRGLEALGGCTVVDGGATRQDSMLAGMRAAQAVCDVFVVHDAARPLFPIAAARELIVRARAEGAALLAVPSTDTLKLVAGGAVTRTLARDGVWLAQTPQAVRRDVLERAIAQAQATGFQGTDDVSLVEHLGGRVAVVEGSPQNLKITRAQDLAVAAALLAQDTAP